MSDISSLVPVTISSCTATQDLSCVHRKRKEPETTETPSSIQAISHKRFNGEEIHKPAMVARVDRKVEPLPFIGNEGVEKVLPVGEGVRAELTAELEPAGLKRLPFELFCYHIGMRLDSKSLVSLLQCDREIYATIISCTPLANKLDNHRLRGWVLQAILTVVDEERKNADATDDLELLKCKVFIFCKTAKALADYAPKRAVAMMKEAEQLVRDNSDCMEDIQNQHLNYLRNSCFGINLRQDLLWLNLREDAAEQDYLPMLETGPRINSLNDALAIAHSFTEPSQRDQAIHIIVERVAMKGATVEEIDCLQKLVDVIQSPGIKDEILVQMAAMQAKHNLEAAVKLVESIHCPATRDYALAGMARIQSAGNLPEAMKMIGFIGELRAKDDARKEIVLENALSNPTEAWDIASQIQDASKKVEVLCGIVRLPGLALEIKQCALKTLLTLADSKECSHYSLCQIAAAVYLMDKECASQVMEKAGELNEKIRGWLLISLHLKEQHPVLARECFEKAKRLCEPECYRADDDDPRAMHTLHTFICLQAFFDPDGALESAKIVASGRWRRRAFLAVTRTHALLDIHKALDMINTIENVRTQAECLCEMAWLASKNDVPLTHDILRKVLLIFKEHPDGFTDPEQSNVKGQVLILVRMMQVLVKIGDGETESYLDIEPHSLFWKASFV